MSWLQKGGLIWLQNLEIRVYKVPRVNLELVALGHLHRIAVSINSKHMVCCHKTLEEEVGNKIQIRAY